MFTGLPSYFPILTMEGATQPRERYPRVCNVSKYSELKVLESEALLVSKTIYIKYLKPQLLQLLNI